MTLLVSLLLACNDGAGPIDTDGADTDVPADPRLETDIVPIFQQSCGSGDNSCHSSVAYSANADQGCRGWLSLEDASLGSTYDGEPTGCEDLDLYARLMQLSAWECHLNGDSTNGNVGYDIAYVAPGDAENSYLWRKISGGVLCDFTPDTPSQPMPLGGTLTGTERAILKAWIDNGAKRVGD